mmetsp:Transcript_37652/g.94442  ORF Transcript_37652/g.94442 Transcript_37652/m.94442 type:complete len:257 (-) Transcript_37652:1931-2701(-)
MPLNGTIDGWARALCYVALQRECDRKDRERLTTLARSCEVAVLKCDMHPSSKTPSINDYNLEVELAFAERGDRTVKIFIDMGRLVRLVEDERVREGASGDESAVELAMDLSWSVQLSGSAKELLAEYHGTAKLFDDGSVPPCASEERHDVENGVLERLRDALAPNIDPPILFLDLLPCIPLDKSVSPFKYRLALLEDRLVDECWDEEDESEALKSLEVANDDEEEEEDEAMPPRPVPGPVSGVRSSQRKKAKTKSG